MPYTKNGIQRETAYSRNGSSIKCVLLGNKFQRWQEFQVSSFRTEFFFLQVTFHIFHILSEKEGIQKF